MRKFPHKLVAAVAAGALMGALGTARAEADNRIEPIAMPGAATDSANGARILFFSNQGNSPESDPSAHLLMIKDPAPVPPAPPRSWTRDPAPLLDAPPVGASPPVPRTEGN